MFSYISKPALNEHIISVFCQLKETLDHATQTRNDLNAYRSYRGEIILARLIQSRRPEAADIDEFTELLPSAAGGAEYYIALLEIDADPKTALDSQDKLLSHVLRDRLDTVINTYECFLEKTALSLTQTALLISAGKAEVLRKLTELLRGISEEFMEDAQATLTIGLSSSFHELSALHAAYIQAQKALEQKVKYGRGTIIDYASERDFNRQTPVFSEQEVGQIIRHIRASDERAVYLTVTHYFESLKNVSVDIVVVRSAVVDLIAEVVLQIFKTQHTKHLMLGSTVHPTSDIKAMSSLAEIQTYLVKVLEKALLFTQVMSGLDIDAKACSPLVQKAIAFVVSNYMNSISISDVASALHISESRFAHSFKDATGKSFVTFLTEYRIYMAKAMIQSGQYRLSEISELVGYNNPITFRKAFSKVVGTVPSKYM